MAETSTESTGIAGGGDRLWGTKVGDDLAFLLARANALSLARVNAALADFDIKIRHYSVLAIAATDARPSQRELSEFLQLDPSQIVSLVDYLEKRGLVTREPDPRDRRANVVVATPQGKQLAEQARDAVKVSEDHWFSILPQEDAERLGSILRTLAGSNDLATTR
ncbi:MarR family winged helix-turn-helix transcriptional regulator [Leucobacter sp. W1038]|uniref:MarR family winged helix-turn-helix transcriptional regulator n=1 Tax=Leucobacter sp. W1038 TaxID=3438281 RepID=UPI003D96017D